MNKLSFKDAYYELLKLKDSDTKIAILFASHFARVKDLADFFKEHSDYSVLSYSIAKDAKIVAPDGESVSVANPNVAVKFLLEQNPDYIILEDNGDLKYGMFTFDYLPKMIKKAAKSTPVIIASDFAEEFMLMFMDAISFKILCPNDRSLKIRASCLENNDLYRMNERTALGAGLFLANEDFYEKYIKKNHDGDRLFEEGKYDDALHKYFDTLSFHVDSCNSINSAMSEFMLLVVYIRIYACSIFESKPMKDMQEDTLELFAKLKKSIDFSSHRKMLHDYYVVYKGLSGKTLNEVDYLLYLREYIL